MHIDREIGHAFVLGLFGIGARHEHAPVGQVRQSIPNLLSVDDPLITIAHCTCTKTSKV